jgi:hypothetical protein
MLPRKRRTSLKDANRLLPHDLTDDLRLQLENLPSSRKVDYLLKEVFSKFVSKDTDPAKVRRQRAINKWLATEKNNEATNVRLLNYHEDFYILPHVKMTAFLTKAASIVTKVIGEVPAAEALDGAFSGGASTSRKRTEGHPALKYLGIADATPGLAFLLDSLFEERPLWQDIWSSTKSGVRSVPGNVLFTVPKTTEIDRCACKEPDLNMYIQKGLGNEIRRCLKRVGIDLRDQSRNRDLAREGSLHGHLATIDLSSASDSISYGLVQALLPPIWFSLLADSRSPVTVIDGEVHKNEMFSSMGNGFTFELESLLFYAIARATAYFRGVSGVISVYGDDIIVPTDLAEDLVHCLSFLGFETNVSKSFWSGDFRESCGGHYVSGYDITPFYVRQPIVRLVDLIHVCNSIRKWAQAGAYPILDPEVEELWFKFANQVPRRFWGGYDCADKSRLVSFWSPTKPYKLLPLRKEVSTDVGGYLHWHDSRGEGEPQDNSFGVRIVERTLYREVLVGQSSFNSKPDHVFLSEVVAQDLTTTSVCEPQ